MSHAPATRFRRAIRSGSLTARAPVERSVPYWPQEAITALQRRRLRSIIRHANAHVPFYRAVMAQRGLTPDDLRDVGDLARLPLIDGAMVQERIEEFVTPGVTRDTAEVFFTSGSQSGVRRRILWDDTALVGRVAIGERHRAVVRELAGESRGEAALRSLLGSARAQAIVDRIGGRGRGLRVLWVLPGRPTSRSLQTLWSELTLMPRRPVREYSLSPREPFAKAAAFMGEIRPHVIFSFGSYLDLFLRSQAETSAPVWAPRVWSYTGDGLSDGGRELARRLGCHVHSCYSTMEFGRIGFECELSRGYHLNVDACALRLVDEEGRDVAPGEPGEVVCSGLLNRGMVLLNYRLGDRAVLAPGQCPCGRTFPLLDRVEGRSSEVVILPDGRSIAQVTLEGMMGKALWPALRVQLAQPKPDRLHWRVVPFKDADRDALRVNLVAQARSALGDGIETTVEFVDDLSTPENGKFTRMVGLEPEAVGLRDQSPML